MNLSLLGWGDAGWGDEMAIGALMTLAVATSSFALGLVFATGLAAMKLSRSRLLRAIADVYTTVVRGIPELLIIYLVFFGGGIVLRAVAAGMFGYEDYVDLPIFLTGMLCIGVSSSAYSTEVIRGAVLAVPKGQIEAGRAIGMGPVLRFRRILVPQVLRYALPGLGNVWQLTLKDTSLISVIGLFEIMRYAFQGAGSTREPFTFYFAALLLYLILTSLSNRGILRAERWANKGVRRA